MKIRERIKSEFDNSCMRSSFTSCKILVRDHRNYIIFATATIEESRILKTSCRALYHKSSRPYHSNRITRVTLKKNEPQPRTSFIHEPAMHQHHFLDSWATHHAPSYIWHICEIVRIMLLSLCLSLRMSKCLMNSSSVKTVSLRSFLPILCVSL